MNINIGDLCIMIKNRVDPLYNTQTSGAAAVMIGASLGTLVGLGAEICHTAGMHEDQVKPWLRATGFRDREVSTGFSVFQNLRGHRTLN